MKVHRGIVRSGSITEFHGFRRQLSPIPGEVGAVVAPRKSRDRRPQPGGRRAPPQLKRDRASSAGSGHGARGPPDMLTGSSRAWQTTSTGPLVGRSAGLRPTEFREGPRSGIHVHPCPARRKVVRLVLFGVFRHIRDCYDLRGSTRPLAATTPPNLEPSGRLGGSNKA
jgi:hypothetical protein